MHNVEYFASWSYLVGEPGGASNCGPMHTLRLSSSYQPGGTVDALDVEANKVFSAVYSVLGNFCESEAPVSIRDGAYRAWSLGQVGDGPQ